MIGQELLYEKACEGDVVFIKNGIENLEIQKVLDSQENPQKNTAIIGAAINGHQEAVIILAREGANLQLENEARETVFYWAYKQKQAKALISLIVLGARWTTLVESFYSTEESEPGLPFLLQVCKAMAKKCDASMVAMLMKWLCVNESVMSEDILRCALFEIGIHVCSEGPEKLTAYLAGLERLLCESPEKLLLTLTMFDKADQEKRSIAQKIAIGHNEWANSENEFKEGDESIQPCLAVFLNWLRHLVDLNHLTLDQARSVIFSGCSEEETNGPLVNFITMKKAGTKSMAFLITSDLIKQQYTDLFAPNDEVEEYKPVSESTHPKSFIDSLTSMISGDNKMENDNSELTKPLLGDQESEETINFRSL